MIKNFKQRIEGKAIRVPVWSAALQEYKVLSVYEVTSIAGFWSGQISTKKINSSFGVPIDIDVTIEKRDGRTEWDVQVVYTDSSGKNAEDRAVTALPKHFKTPETFGQLIADIIDDGNVNHF